jgi:hypothetical protein
MSIFARYFSIPVKFNLKQAFGSPKRMMKYFVAIPESFIFERSEIQ